MKPVPKSYEKSLFLSLKKLFHGLINNVRNGFVKGDEVAESARQFLASEEVDRYINGMIGRMTKRIRIDTARNWREAAVKSGYGPAIYEATKHEMEGPVGRRVWDLIADNVAYIKTVPEEWARYITQYAAREALKGKRPDEVERELRKVMPEHMTKNLKCIARTEVAKANAAICEARAESCGIKCYFWRCVHDNRVRDSHWDMDGLLIFYDDPPSPEALFPYVVNKRGDMVRAYGPYHAGNTFNCRCYQEPVVDPQFLPDTFKYYRHGNVHNTTKSAFLRQFGNIA